MTGADRDDRFSPGAAVWTVTAAVIVAGRVITRYARNRIMIDQCTIGQHLPQSYRQSELHPLTAADTELYGLCPGCLGYGTPAALPGTTGLAGYYPYSISEIPDPCPVCEGTGRRWIRVTTTRTGDGGTAARLDVLPHDPVWPPPAARKLISRDTCVACGVTSGAHLTPSP